MSAYYNENDPEKAAWIRELVRRNVVAPGDVDERSITEVRADDLRGYKQCHFFAGIAVWSYALRLSGWPDDRQCWTGSCPCPSFSAAGKGEGFDDARHLWPAWWPLIRERRPATIFGEQVAAAIRHGWWDLVSTDLESETYAAASAVLTSASVGGSDIRERLYWLADANQRRPQQCDAGKRAVQFSSEKCEANGLAEPMHTERRPLSLDRADGCDGKNGGRAEAHGEPGTCSEVFGLAHSTPRGRGMLRSAPREAGHTESSDEIGGLAHAMFPGHHGQKGSDASPLAHSNGEDNWILERDGSARVQHLAADALKGYWRTADWLFCTDGRWRPVEAGTFPLDSGSPARLGRLRGYGDAVNAEVAKAFIEAAMSIL